MTRILRDHCIPGNELEVTVSTLDNVQRLSRDLRKSAETLTIHEARYLVDAYYQMQEDRIRAGNQTFAMQGSGEPNEVIRWLSIQSHVLENQVKGALDRYSNAVELGRWARSVKGIGPVIAAGLLAHIDIAMAPTVGHIWRFAGLDPTCEWKKGHKRPWNARLNVLCWKIGESFVKVSGHEDAFYGQVYLERKAQEQANNEARKYSDQAEAKLAKFKISKDTEAYKHYIAGKLPPGHIHARAKRYAVKLFLAHYHEVGYTLLHGTNPPLPYPIAHLGHAHKIDPPF
jgi:hypothetical protein